MGLKSFIFVLGSISCAFLALSETDPACIQKLMPCRYFLNGNTNPPASCCAPLINMIENDVPCLCSIMNDENLLNQLNITQKDGLKLNSLCFGPDPDLSQCKEGATPGASPTTPSNSSATPASPATPSNSSSPSGSNSNEKNSAKIVAYSGMVSFSLFVVSLIAATI